MRIRALQSAANNPAYDDFDSNEDLGALAFTSGERLGAPRGGRGTALLRTAIFLAALLGAVWVLVKTDAPVRDWLSAAASMMEARAPAPAETDKNASLSGQVEKFAATREILAAPGAETGTAVETPTAVVMAPEAVSAEETAQDTPAEPVVVARLPPPKADPADPNQKRAIAVGLHPDLSRALLGKLTETDYRNAGVAIRTALAETADTDVFAWPREPTAKLALFEVKFVKGAASDCRRYVVTVTKDRWSTTARAMEKCGADLPKRKVVKAGAG